MTLDPQALRDLAAAIEAPYGTLLEFKLRSAIAWEQVKKSKSFDLLRENYLWRVARVDVISDP